LLLGVITGEVVFGIFGEVIRAEVSSGLSPIVAFLAETFEVMV
jgi:hypothetical protein